jgi:hypothetical protein
VPRVLDCCHRRRVLKPGGFAWLTIHGDDTWRRMKAHPTTDAMRKALSKWNVYQPADGPEQRINQTEWLYESRAAIPHGVTVLTTARERAMVWPLYKVVNATAVTEHTDNRVTMTFTSYEYVRRVWSRVLPIAQILPQSSGLPRHRWTCGTPICQGAEHTDAWPVGQDVVLLRKSAEPEQL